MGEVYRAVHSKIGRHAAVKLMNRSAVGPEYLQRFLNEARIQANLHHPNIATLYDFCEFDGRPCIIMEYIEGETLADRIRARGPLDRHDALLVVRAINDALGYIHNQGIIHRDIKSTNVRITPSGVVKLLDFGIAKSGASPALTMTGAVIGTLQYISPEQFAGSGGDERSDIWSLGVLLYEMTTSRMPFQSDSIGGLYQQVCGGSYAPPSALNARMPRELEPVIARCLRKSPAERYQSARDLATDLERLANPHSRPLPPPTPPPIPVVTSDDPSRPSADSVSDSGIEVQSQRKLFVVAGVAVTAVVVVLAGVLMLLSGGDTAQNTTVKTVQQPPKAVSQPLSHPEQPAVQPRTFTLELTEGQADVYKNGQKVGATPYRFDAKPGEQIDLVLKREGYEDKSVQMALNDNKHVYTFTMSRKY